MALALCDPGARDASFAQQMDRATEAETRAKLEEVILASRQGEAAALAEAARLTSRLEAADAQLAEEKAKREELSIELFESRADARGSAKALAESQAKTRMLAEELELARAHSERLLKEADNAKDILQSCRGSLAGATDLLGMESREFWGVVNYAEHLADQVKTMVPREEVRWGVLEGMKLRDDANTLPFFEMEVARAETAFGTDIIEHVLSGGFLRQPIGDEQGDDDEAGGDGDDEAGFAP